MTSRGPRGSRIHLGDHAALGEHGSREERRDEKEGQKEGSCDRHAGLMHTYVNAYVGIARNTPLKWAGR
jgi:hypothetical protein